MNLPRSSVWWRRGLACALCLVFGQPSVSSFAQETNRSVFPFPIQDANGAPSAAYARESVGKAVLALLKSGDSEVFAAAMTPSPEDLAPIIARYPDTKGAKKSPGNLASDLARKRARLADSARRLLARATALGVDFGAMELEVRVDEAPANAGYNYLGLLPEGHWFHATRRLEVVVSARSENAAAKSGEYRLVVADVIALPRAWLVDGSLGWAAMPDSAADEDMRMEMKLSKAAAGYGSLSGGEDPALARLAETVATLLRNHDIAAYERALALTPEAEWALRLRQDPGAASYPKGEFIQWHEEKSAENHAAVENLLATLARSGIDFGAAHIRVTDVRVRNLMVRSETDPMLGLEGNKLRITLRVEGEGKAANGRPVAGEYVLASDEILRDGGSWFIERELIWEKLPEGVVDEAVAAEIAFEAHVNKQGTLPVGTPAPDIEFVRMDDGQKGRLSDLRGKVVILDFWSTTCGPCQEPLAKMQKYREANPRWGDRVAVVTVSIDATLQEARAHLEKRGWTSTLNVWAGEGGWKSGPAKAFRVKAIPTSYVIDGDGRIAAEDPSHQDAPGVVNRLLK